MSWTTATSPTRIVTAAANSADLIYNGIDAADVAVTNTDNDAAGIIVTPTSGLTTTEAGGTATFTIVLASQPTADVTIALSVERSDRRHGQSCERRVYGRGEVYGRELEHAGDHHGDRRRRCRWTTATSPTRSSPRAATSTDATYNGIDAADVAVTNTDNDAAGITVTPISGPDDDEAGGTATFTVVLNSAADRRRDDRAELERRDRRHGRAGEPDLHDRQLERGADRHGDRRRRRRWTTATSPTRS